MDLKKFLENNGKRMRPGKTIVYITNPQQSHQYGFWIVKKITPEHMILVRKYSTVEREFKIKIPLSACAPLSIAIVSKTFIRELFRSAEQIVSSFKSGTLEQRKPIKIPDNLFFVVQLLNNLRYIEREPFTKLLL